MSRIINGIEKGLRIYRENSDTEYVDFIFGAAAPGGDTGEQDDASIGSLYLRQDGATSKIYQKKTNVGATSDWQEVGSTSLQLGFRPEKVRAVTSENVSPGLRNLTTTPFTDDDGATLDASDFAVGEFIIANSGGVAVLLEATVVSAPNVTFAAPGSAPVLAEFDTFLTPNFLPDPDGQENQALVQINDAGAVVKVGDVDWEFATGINLSGAYSAASGNVTSADSVESAIEKLDGNNDAQDTAIGISQGDTNMSTYTGDLINDNESAKQNIQQLETAIEGISIQKSGTLAQNTATNVDSYLADDFQTATWVIVARDSANPARVKRIEVQQVHNGHGAADASSSKESANEKVNIGNVNLQINTVLTGAAGAQLIHLELETNEASGISYTIERVNFLPLAG